MKTYTLILIFLAGFLNSNARPTDNPRSPHFATDEIVQNKPGDNQRHPRIAAAFNGWLYAAYTINDTTTKRGGIYVSFSKDNGQTWKKFVTYEFNNSFYRYTDVAVGGSDTSNISVFVAGTLLNLSNGSSTIYIDKFDGSSGDLITGQVYERSLGALSITSMAVFCDNSFPSSLSAPFSVSILYAVHGGVQDSLFFAASVNGGQTFTIRNTIAHTTGAFRKVALGYGRSPSVIAGAYYAAWEMLNTPASTLGHIYVSHTKLTIGNGWNTPFCLDSLSPATLGLCRNPAVSCQQSALNNDVGDLSVVVGFERASAGNMTNMDIVGCGNKKAFSSSTWNPFTVATTAENDLQPALAFNPASNRFLITYYDSTNGQLPYAVQDVNLNTPNAWLYLTSQYNDQRTNLTAPHPVIAINPSVQEACFLWTGENAGNGNGVALFDAEYAGLATGIITPALTENWTGNPYPNPAKGNINIPLGFAAPVKMNSVIYDLLGNQVGGQEEISFSSGTQLLTFDISTLENGVYFCRMETGGVAHTIRFIVQH